MTNFAVAAITAAVAAGHDMHPDAIAWAQANGNRLSTPEPTGQVIDAGTSRYDSGLNDDPFIGGRTSQGKSRKPAAKAVKMATPNQLAAIIKWGPSKVLSPRLADVVIDAMSGAPVTFADASAVMDAPWKPREAALVAKNDTTNNKVTEIGFYWLDNVLHKVQAAQDSGRLYAKKLVGGTDEGGAWAEFQMAPGAVSKIDPATKLDGEALKVAASTYGPITGKCIRCGRSLNDEDSIARSMGSTCYGKA